MEYRFKDSLFLYVVEGNDDENKLRQLGVKHIVKTNGKFIRKEVISFLKLAQEKRDLILLLDPDGPGREITKKMNVYINLEKGIKEEKDEALLKEVLVMFSNSMNEKLEMVNRYYLKDQL